MNAIEVTRPWFAHLRGIPFRFRDSSTEIDRNDFSQPPPGSADHRPMAKRLPPITIPNTWKQAAYREGLTVREWIIAACELALVRGSTR